MYYTVSFRFGQFRFDLFRFASISFRFGEFRFVSFRYISFRLSFRSLQVPQFPQYYLHVFSSLVLVTPRGFIVYISQITAVSMLMAASLNMRQETQSWQR